MMSSGFFRMQQTCPDCAGRGSIITEYCPVCNGKGYVRAVRNIEVAIPPGVDNNSRLRIRNEGELGAAGAGDLYLYIRLLPHAVFRKEGKDIYSQIDVSFVKAALGGEVLVPTLDGRVMMKIPPGTQSGKVFRLRAKGMPDLHGGINGDQYVKVMVQVPRRLTSEQRKILEEFARISGEDFSAKEDTFTEKLKKVFR